MSHDFIENALTRLRDDSELVALRADKVRLTAEVSCLEAVIRSHERVDCLLVTSLKKQLVEVDAEVARLNLLIANSEQENARLKAEVDQLVHKVNYWRIEAETDNARWLRCLEDKERLERAGDLMLKYACANMPYPPYVTIVKDWNAAKGVQS